MGLRGDRCPAGWFFKNRADRCAVDRIRNGCPTGRGSFNERADWVVLDPDGSITCMPNSAFVKLFH